MSEAAAGAVVAIWNGIAEGKHGEFYRWHEVEHMPERVGIPGFLRGRRYRAVSAEPEFFTRYDLETPAVSTGEAYLARLNAPTAWTLSTVPHFRDTSRALSRKLFGHGRGSAAWLATVRVFGAQNCATADAIVEAARALFDADGLVSLQVFETDTGASSGTTREKASRAPDRAFPAWTILIEARNAAATEAIRDRLAGSLRAISDAYGLSVDAGLYLLEFDLLPERGSDAGREQRL